MREEGGAVSGSWRESEEWVTHRVARKWRGWKGFAVRAFQAT